MVDFPSLDPTTLRLPDAVRAQIANDLKDNAQVEGAAIAGLISAGGSGTYTKPAGGIPAADLDATTQTTLGLATTALQSVTLPTADTLSGVTTVGKAVLEAADGLAARTAIGAGTSNVAIGTAAGAAPDAARTFAAVGYAGTLQGAWVGNHAYALSDVVIEESGLFSCTIAHTSNAAGFQYDREKWSAVPVPVVGAGSTVQMRQLATTTVGTGLTAPLTAGVFQRTPKQFSHNTEKTFAIHQAAADLTITQGTGAALATGTATGGSVVLTSPTVSSDGWYRGAALAAAMDITAGSLKVAVNISAYSGNYMHLDVTSAAGGTDFTNYTRFTLMSGNIDQPRLGMWQWIGANTGDPDSTVGTGATLTAVTGYRYVLFRSSAQFTVEIASRLIFQPSQSAVGKCILWLDDGNFAAHQTAIKTAAKYGLPVTLAPIAAMTMNGSGGISADAARFVQDFLGGQVAVHAFADADHNRVQSGTQLFEQLLDYQHFGAAAGLHGTEDMAYWSTGFTGPNTLETELTVKKMFRSARGGIARQVESLPPVDPYKTKSMITGGSDTSTGTWQPYAQRAINSKGLVQFVWHDMSGTILTEFATFCAWLAANSATIRVVTPQTAFDPLCMAGA